MAGIHGGDIYFDIKVNMKPFDKAMQKVERSSDKASASLERKLNRAMTTASNKMGKTLDSTMRSSAQLAGKKVEMAMKKSADAASKSFKNSMRDTTKNMNKQFKSSMSAGMKSAGSSAGKKAGNAMGDSMKKSTISHIGKLKAAAAPAMAKAGAALGITFGAAMGTAITSVPVAGWALAAIGALFVLTNKMATLGDEIDKNSQKMGISARGYQEWSFILAHCGASMDSLKPSMKKLAVAAETGSAAFSKLGISQQEVASMNTEQLFGRTVQALQNVKDGTERTYLASQLLGKGGTQLGAVFNMTNFETDQLRTKLNYLGAVMSDQGVKNSAALKDALTDLKLAMRGYGNFLVEYLAPVFVWFINKVMIPFIVFFRKLYSIITNVLRGLVQFIADLFRPLISLLGKIPIFGKVIDFFKGVGNKRTSKGLKETAEGMQNVKSGISGTGSSAKKSKKQVQDLKRELMGFDKITKLQGENKGTTDSDTGTTSPSSYTPTTPSTPTVTPIDTSSMFDTSNLDEQSETWYQKLKKTIKEKWSNLKTDIQDAVRDFWKWVDDKVGGWWDKHFGGKKFEIELPSWDELKNRMYKGLGNIYERIRKWLFLKFGIELPSWTELTHSMNKGLGGVYERIRKWLRAKFGIELPSWDELKKKLDDRLGHLWERFRKKKDGKISIRIPTWSELKQKWKNLLDKFKDKKVKIKLDLAAKWENAKAWINRNVITRVNRAIPKSLKRLGLQLPYLAQGGYVKANTPRLAMIGDNKREGEIVAPESKLAAMAAMAANSGADETNMLLRQLIALVSNLDLNVELDGEKIKKNTVRRINNHTRATGNLEILI